MTAISHQAARVHAESVAGSDAELLDQFLAYLDRRREEAQRRFDDLARQRASMSASERASARDALRARAAELRSELRRSSMVASLTRGLLRTPLSRPRLGLTIVADRSPRSRE